MRFRRMLIAAVVLALVVAFAVPAGADTAADQDIADESVLTADEVPAGFEQEPSDSSDDDEFDIPGCKALSDAAKALNEAPNQEVQFELETQSDFSSINNQVSVLTSTKRAKSALNAYASRTALRCIKAASEQELDGTLEIERTKFKAGDQSVAYEAFITVETDTEAADLYITIQIVRIGRALAAFGYSNTGAPPPSIDVDEMTDTVLNRLEDAL